MISFLLGGGYFLGSLQGHLAMRKYPVRARAEVASFVYVVGGERLLGHTVGFAGRSMHFFGTRQRFFGSKKERIFIELMMSDRKLKASSEGSK